MEIKAMFSFQKVLKKGKNVKENGFLLTYHKKNERKSNIIKIS